MKIAPFAVIAATALPVSLVGSSAFSAPPIYVAGYEYLLGDSCTVGGQAGTCGVQFGFWTGGSGAGPFGWTTFPGNGKGLGKATLNYYGKAAFGTTLNVMGTFELLFTSAPKISAIVSGSVRWPLQGQYSTCGLEVATVTLTVAYVTGGTGRFTGCLHDLPAGSVIPPKIWGGLS